MYIIIGTSSKGAIWDNPHTHHTQPHLLPSNEPTVHNTMKEAQTQAMKLAKKHPTRDFYVFCAVGMAAAPAQPEPVWQSML